MEKNEYTLFREKTEKALSGSVDGERAGLEFDLIERRGWEKYAVALQRILRGVRRNLPDTALSGTASDLKIFGGSGSDSVMERPLNASFSVVWPFGEMIEKDMRRLLCIFSRNLRGLELHTEKRVLTEEFMGKTVMVVISEEVLDGDTVSSIADEIRSGRAGSPLLMKYLVLTVDAHFGLSVDLSNHL